MKKLWLSALTAVCLLAGTAAQAGDHHRGPDRGWHGERHDQRGHDHRDRHWDRGWNGARVYYYQPARVYYSPVRYYPPRPVYYESRDYRRYGDPIIHGSINVNF